MLIYIFILLLIIIYFLKIKNIYVKSHINNKYYYVQKNNSKKSVIILSKLSLFLKKLLFNLDINNIIYKSNFNTIEKIKKNDLIIQEKSNYENNTSYTLNKKKIVMCLKHKNIYHDINIIKYILIHELSHAICPDIGHTTNFYNINKYLLKESIRLGLYNPDNYKLNPINYCGILLNEYLL